MSSRDSFDRFCDDLCEHVLSCLWFADRLRFECVSSAWRRSLFRAPRVLDLNYHAQHRNALPLRRLLSSTNSEYVDLTLSKVVETVLKKCAHVCDVRLSGVDCGERVLRAIRDHCAPLSSLELSLRAISDDSLMEFGARCGPQLRTLAFNSPFQCDTRHYALLLRLCPNVRTLKSVHIRNLVDINAEDVLIPHLSAVEMMYGCKRADLMAVFVARYGQRMRHFGAVIDDFYVDYDSQNAFMTDVARMTALQKLSIVLTFRCELTPAFVDRLVGIALACAAIDDLRLETAIPLSYTNHKHVSHARIFHAMRHFTRLKRLELDLRTFDKEEVVDGVHPFDASLVFSVRCLAGCRSLTSLTLKASLSNSFFADIDVHVPQLRHVSLLTLNKISDSAMKCLSKLAELKSISISTEYYYDNALITDAGVCAVIESCPLFQSFSFNPMPNISDRTIDTLIAIAIERPRIEFVHSFSDCDIEYDSEQCFDAQKVRNKRLPNNLSLRLTS